jgi:7,8-dihydropterin-6-yl-methyl-4-(beta-D-ribofuranosyl)aminobenzene 5'-phosphate synthase
MEQIGLDPVDSVRITSLVDNVADTTAPSTGPARRTGWGRGTLEAHTMVGGRTSVPLVAEHGFSALVDVTKGEKAHRILFDTGVSPNGMIENMRRLEVDPTTIEAIVLSHGHYDHTAGMHGLIEALGLPHLPVYLHPEAWNRRRVVIDGRDPREMPTTSRRALEDAGFDIIERAQPSFLLGGSVLVTGEIDRTAAFEQGFPGHEALRGATWQPDPFILDDQALVLNLRGMGLVVVTGCGHAGVVNILRHVTRLTDTDQVHALIGGFHLGSRAMLNRIAPTVEAIAAFDPTYLVPAHCTGFRATHALAERLPEALIPNTVGTVYTF